MVSIVRGISGIARTEATDPIKDASDYEHARSKLEEDLIGIRSTVKILSSNDVDVGLSSDEVKTLNTLMGKFYGRAKFSTQEAEQLISLRDKVGQVADMYATAEDQKAIAAESLLDTYQSILNDSRLTRGVRMTAMRELSGLLRVLNVSNSSLSTINMRKNNRIIEQARAELANQNVKIKYSDTVKVANLTNRSKDERDTLDRFNIRQTGRNLRDSFLNTPSQFSVGSVRKEALSSGLGALGLGDLDSVFGISDKLDGAISSMFRKRKDEPDTTDEELKAISREILKSENKPDGESSTEASAKVDGKEAKVEITTPDATVNPKPSFGPTPEEEQNQKLDEINNSIRELINETRSGQDELSRKQTQLINGQSTLVDIDEQLVSVTRANGRANHEEIDPFANEQKQGAADSIFDDLIGGGDERGRRGRRGRGRRGRTRLGRGLSRFGRLGRMAGRAVDAAATGGLARGAARGGGALLRAGLKGAKFIPGIGLAVTAGMGVYDAVSGWDGDKAKELFGSDDNWAKAGSSAASLSSGLTLGLASPEDVVNVAKSAVDTVQKTYEGAVNIANNLTASFSGMYKNASDWLSKSVSDTSKWFSDSYDSVTKSITGEISELSNLVTEFINDPMKSIGEGIGGLFDWLSDLPVVGDFFKGLKKGAVAVSNGIIGAGASIVNGARAVGGIISNGYDSAVDAGGSILQSAMQNASRYLPSSKEQTERKNNLAEYAKQQGIDDKELALFMGQVQHESGNFRYNKELASGKAYEGRKDLGNVNPGDGVRYKGRGWIQLTGRANYQKYGKMLGIDLENNPEMAEDPEIANKLAVAYWKDRVRPQLEKKGSTVEVATKAVNGGYNGLADRAAYTAEWMKNGSDAEASKSGATQVAQNVPLEVPKAPTPTDDVNKQRQDQNNQLAAMAAGSTRNQDPAAITPNVPSVVTDKSDTIDDYGLAFFNKMVFS
ncbi:putative glycoside hydrolase [Escherichia phage vB_EcoM_IME392]|nr:putative glycoside hydrolase [Escherichia phage vB_EcoM_IME392]